MRPIRIAIVGTPRSGSSYLASILESRGFTSLFLETTVKMNPSQFNPEGYFEDTSFNLFTDQLIRFTYGSRYSFLNPPPISGIVKSRTDDWSFDLDEKSVEIPEDYIKKIEFYCGNSWDVWGLTRMLGAGKWNRIYSKLGYAKSSDLLKSLITIRKSIISGQNIYVKDARLIFVLDYFHDLFSHVIYLTRETHGLTKSIQSHYGHRIFIGPEFEGFGWVSNHFNYKIPYLTVNEFVSRYESAAMPKSKENHFIRVKLDEIDTISKVNAWLDGIGLAL